VRAPDIAPTPSSSLSSIAGLTASPPARSSCRVGVPGSYRWATDRRGAALLTRARRDRSCHPRA
jgi:hypothetical protein